MNTPLIQWIAAALFGVALLHTFSVKFFERLSHRYPRHAGLFHLLGEVEVARTALELARARGVAIRRPDSLCGPAATAESVAAFAGRFPAHEHALALHDSSPAAVAALLAAERSPTLLCGVYLHGLTLCTDHPPTATAPDAASAQTILGPRLAAALSGRSA